MWAPTELLLKDSGKTTETLDTVAWSWELLIAH